MIKMGELADLFKEMSTILLALVMVLVVFIYQIMHPHIILAAQVTQWADIAFGFFFGATTTVATYKLGMKAYSMGLIRASDPQPEEQY